MQYSSLIYDLSMFVNLPPSGYSLERDKLIRAICTFNFVNIAIRLVPRLVDCLRCNSHCLSVNKPRRPG